jgi:hypothetical protein
LCRLFFAMRVSNPRISSFKQRRHGVYHLRAFPCGGIFLPETTGTQPRGYPRVDGIGLSVLHGLPRKKIDRKEREECISRGLIVQAVERPPSRHSSPNSVIGLRVDGLIKNYDLLKGWLSECLTRIVNPSSTAS